MHRKLGAALGWALLLVSGCGRPASAPPDPAAGKEPDGVRLVLFLVVDQMRDDYLDRYRPLFSQGLERLLSESIRFREAYQDHAYPRTSPGHATLATGRFPRHHGLVANHWIDRRTGDEVQSVGSSSEISPRSLEASTLADWLKERDPRSKVFSLSTKDRGAVFLGGHHADRAFWFDDEVGAMVSSSYYTGPSPEGLGDPSGRWGANHAFGTLWKLTLAPDQIEAVAAHPVDWGYVSKGFPHAIGEAIAGPDEGFWYAYSRSPLADDLIEAFAEELLVTQGLGEGSSVDLLGISFSALDRVGHKFGPNSPEVADTLARLDRTLGRLLEAIDREVGLEHVLISLSSDHGVVPLWGEPRADGAPTHKLEGQEIACVQGLEARLEERFGPGPWVRKGPFLEEETLAAHHLEAREVEQAARALLESCPGIARVWTRSELSGPEPPAGEAGRLFYNAFSEERSPDLLFQLEPFELAWTADGADHISIYDYDRHVPWLLRRPDGRGGEITARVATADVAPTLADLLGVVPPRDLDGASRLALVKGLDSPIDPPQ
jgi:arylsulfatase A-like enzyme